MARILLTRIRNRAAAVLVLLAIIGAIGFSIQAALGILTGGILGLANLQALAWGVRGLLGTEKATAKMLFLGQFRFLFIFITLALLTYLRVVNIFGVLAGFSVVFALTLTEGYRLSRGATGNDAQ